MKKNQKKVRKIYFLQKTRTEWLSQLIQFLEKEEIDMHVQCTHFSSMQKMFEQWKIEKPFVIVFGTGISVKLKLDFLKKYRLVEQTLPLEVICLYSSFEEEVQLRVGLKTLEKFEPIFDWDQGKPKSWELINSIIFTKHFEVQIASILKTLWKAIYNRVDDTRVDHFKSALAEAMQKIQQLERAGIEDWPQEVIESFNQLKQSLNETFVSQSLRKHQLFFYDDDERLNLTQELILEAWSYHDDVGRIQRFLQGHGKTLEKETIRKQLKILDEKFNGSAILKMRALKEIQKQKTSTEDFA